MELLNSPFSVTALLTIVTAIIALLLTLWVIAALRRGKLFSGVRRLLLALPFVLLAAFSGVIALGVQGYRALTDEQVAATIETRPTGPQTFEALFIFPTGESKRFHLKGDELYIDARILKWHYVANLVGMQTLYELERVAGRYRNLEEERSKPRTIESLAVTEQVDLFALRKRFDGLSRLFDAEYGSATFVPADREARYELRVSTTGLLIRPLANRDEGTI